MNRRCFIGSILAACSAPAIVRADSLMRIVPRSLVVAPLPFSLPSPLLAYAASLGPSFGDFRARYMAEQERLFRNDGERLLADAIFGRGFNVVAGEAIGAGTLVTLRRATAPPS